MKKSFVILFSVFLILSFTGCKFSLDGTSDKVSWMTRELDAYFFDSTDEIRDSIKYMIKEGTGFIPLNNKNEEKFDELIADGFTFDKQKFNDNPSYYYPDFSKTKHDYIVIPYTVSHDISNSGGMRRYYDTFALWIYKYDRENKICSEVIILDTGNKK